MSNNSSNSVNINNYFGVSFLGKYYNIYFIIISPTFSSFSIYFEKQNESYGKKDLMSLTFCNYNKHSYKNVICSFFNGTTKPLIILPKISNVSYTPNKTLYGQFI